MTKPRPKGPSQAEVDLLIEETDAWLTAVEDALQEQGYDIPTAKNKKAKVSDGR